MSAKHNITRTNLVCWVTTILLISGCFIIFFVHQKYQDFRNTAKLLHLQQERMMTDVVAVEAQLVSRMVAVQLKANPTLTPEAALSATATLVRELNMGGARGGGNLLVLDADGQVLLAPEKGFLRDHLEEVSGRVAAALADPRAKGKSVAAGECTLTNAKGVVFARLRWHAEPLAERPWQVCAVVDMRRAEGAVSANLNRIRVDIIMETVFMLVVAVLVVLVAVRFAWVIARGINREVGALVGYCQAGLKEDVVLNPADFRFREFETIGLAAVGMVRQIKDLLAELKGAAIRSTLASQSKSGVLASVSHDLLSRLNGIMGMAQVMQAAPGSEDDRRRSLETILASGRAMATLIENVDYTSVLDTEGFTPRLAPCSLARIRDQVSRILQQAATARDHELVWEWAGDVPAGMISDEHLLRHVLLNLVEIGIYGNTGGPVRISMSRKGDAAGKACLSCAVHLSDPGFTQTELDEILQFPHVSRRYASVSLRVAICRRLVELLHGKLALALDGGRGLLCAIEFGAATVDVASEGTVPAQSVAPAKKSLPRMKILLVEDDPVNREVTERMLAHFGADVVAAEDGMAAVKQFKAGPFDLVFMDCEMPGMDGYAAAREIRRLEAGGRRVPVVAISGYAMPEDEQRCRDAGMDGFLAKPVALEDLGSMMEKFAPQ
jgi:CheY-like chemotaxis protein